MLAGVTPGYGWVVGDGLPEILVSTATAALEWGAFPWARGVLDNYLAHYVRSDGMVWMRGVQLPSTCRVLTVLALCVPCHAIQHGGQHSREWPNIGCS